MVVIDAAGFLTARDEVSLNANGLNVMSENHQVVAVSDVETLCVGEAILNASDPNVSSENLSIVAADVGALCVSEESGSAQIGECVLVQHYAGKPSRNVDDRQLSGGSRVLKGMLYGDVQRCLEAWMNV